jgi:acyl-CoA synthetase (AMP-forming)/AMP-acid ligase II
MVDEGPRLPDSVRTIPAALAFWAERTPAAPALIAPGRPVVTYADLWRQVRRLGAALQAAGVRREGCVVLLLPEGPAATAYLGAAAAGTALALDPALTPGELDTIVPRLPVAGAIAPEDLSPAVRAYLAARGLPVFTLDVDEARQETTLAGAAAGAERPLAEPRESDVAVLNQTSGTTGRPKLIPRSHGRTLAGGRAHRDLFGLTARDRALVVAPLSLSLGKTALLHSIAAGASLVFPASFDPAAVWATIERERPTWVHAAAGFLELLAHYLGSLPKPAGTSFRFVRVTSAPISPAVCAALEEWLGAPVLPGFSTSESGIIATTLPDDAVRKPGSAGRPVQEVRVVAEDGQDVAPGEEGEFWVRGAKVHGRYLDDPALNAAVFTPEGWFRTGDVGYLDDDGFLFLTGRRNELINRGGTKIAPAEVDAVLAAHPAVREAATFPIPDARLGEDAVVAVVLEEDRAATARELRSWMLDRLATHKVPRRIWFIAAAALPRTRSGKVRRGELARMWAAQR